MAEQNIYKDFSFTTQQTNEVLWTPDSGNRIVITDFIFNMRNTSLSNRVIEIFLDTNEQGNRFYRANFDQSANYDKSDHYNTPWVAKLVDKELKITTSGNLFEVNFTILGYEST